MTGLATRRPTYLAYTLDPATQAFFNSRWLWVTTIHPLFGVIRFLQLVAGRPKAESPTQEMLRDVPFVLNLVLYVIEVIVIVYQRASGLPERRRASRKPTRSNRREKASDAWTDLGAHAADLRRSTTWAWCSCRFATPPIR